MERKAFGKLADGEEATLYTISNTKGMYAQITDFGASIVSLVVKDKDGKIQMWSLVMKMQRLISSRWPVLEQLLEETAIVLQMRKL